MAGVPWAPSRIYDDRGGDRISDLILRRGQIDADRIARSGDIWGHTLAGVGQQVAGAVAAHQEQKEQSKRSKAFEAALQTGDPKDLIRVLGPKDGPAVVNALKATTPDGMKSYGDRMALARDVARGILAVPPENRPQAIEFGKNSLLQNGVFKPEELPEVIDEPFLRQLSAYGADAPKEDETAVVGGALVNKRTGKAIYTAPPDPVKPPNLQHVETAEGIRSFNPQTGELGPVIARGKPNAPPAAEPLVQVSVDGVATWVPRSQAVGQPAAQAARGATGQERTALGFYNRAKQASEDIAPLEDNISKAGLGSQIQLQSGFNILQTDEQQKYRQAQRAFTEARLRKESGAAIPKEEYANDARTYFAQPGDSKAVLEQKRAARKVVLDGLRFGSGRAYDEYYGEAAPTPKNSGAAPSPKPGKVGRFKVEVE